MKIPGGGRWENSAVHTEAHQSVEPRPPNKAKTPQHETLLWPGKFAKKNLKRHQQWLLLAGPTKAKK